ncbi:MAG: Omp28-related outer membrane protein [Bacteroidetes bacterium]|nr:Omp28-related outer membrane protein [Bacteroidota bacterium]
MKKIYTLIATLTVGTVMSAQASFSEDFESYNVGDYIGAVSPNWTTWNGVTGGTEDTQVENLMNTTVSGSKSCYWQSDTSTGGPQDCVLPFGGQYTSGNFTYQMNIFVESGKGAYYNFQGAVTLGNEFAFECYMIQTGTLIVSNTSGTFLTGTYPTNQWFNMRWDINLNTNVWALYINNVLQGSFHNTIDHVAAIDIFAYNGANGGNNQAGYYVDDVSYAYTPYTLPVLNAGLSAIGVLNPATKTPVNITGLVGQTRPMAVTVRNLGTTAITSFDLSYNYNSINHNQSVSSVNIPSLGSRTFVFNSPATLVAGNLPMYAVISNVNAMGADNDNSDDTTWTNANITTVPAPGKVVIGEEATGTWCPWCVRGTVYMDYMSNDFDGYWAGIAVHNSANDPMTVPPYDAGLASTAFPKVFVDRTAPVDPSVVETNFLTRVVITPKATLTNGAMWNATNDTLNVSLTYNFPNAMSGTGYKVVCVLTEDSVSGTGGTWSQNNAYAGGANGPMGGFEALTNPVPYSQIQYNHVARAISPSFLGFAGFPSSITANQNITFDFKFAVPANWNPAKMHIIGMLVLPSANVDNGSVSTVTQAISNGFLNGTTVTGITSPDQPDAAVELYPNPATNGSTNASVVLSKPENVSMTITDVTGKIIAQRDYGMLSGANYLPINTSEFANGIYVVAVKTGSSVTTSKLIIQ